MGGCKYVDERLETSGWNFRVGLTHLSNEGVTGSDVNGGGKLWSVSNGDLEVLELKRSEEVMLDSDGEDDDDQRRQCEEGKKCRRAECPKVNGRWRESVALCDEDVTGESVCDDEKVSEGDGGEANDCEEQISWPQHTVVALETVEMGQKEWNGELEATSAGSKGGGAGGEVTAVAGVAGCGGMGGGSETGGKEVEEA
eukprot:s584_g12.t1